MRRSWLPRACRKTAQKEPFEHIFFQNAEIAPVSVPQLDFRRVNEIAACPGVGARKRSRPPDLTRPPDHEKK